MSEQKTAEPYEVRDPSSQIKDRCEWQKIHGATNPREAAQEFLGRRGYQARDYSIEADLTLEVRHPTSAPTIYEVTATVPRPAFKVGLAKVKR